MNTLYIETATEKSCIAIGNGSNFTSIELPQGPELSRTIAREVSILITKWGKPNQVAVGNGPGSLTGIRVGMSLARALAFGWEIPIREFCSLECFSPDKERYAVLLDARSGGVYVLTNNSKPELLPLEKIKEKVESIPYLVSPHPDVIQKRLFIQCSDAFCDFSRLDLNVLSTI